jgi:uncharacterized membrane protein YfcA
MFLEIATTIGAVFGAFLSGKVPTSALAVIFGLVLLHAAWQSARHLEPAAEDNDSDSLGSRLKLDGSYPTPGGRRQYHVRRVKAGLSLMWIAGAVSGLLGIGSGALKVIAMDSAMGIPFKVSTTTSNFMIGVTAAASAGIYLRRGWVAPELAMPVMLGVLLGSTVGARELAGARTRALRWVFGIVVAVMALEMIYSGMTGRI